jgi:hypothetical protein
VTHRALILFAPLTTLERVNDPHWVNRGRTMYDPGALRFLPPKASAPLLIDHDTERQIGFVSELTRVDWTSGPWLAGLATITDAPGWLKQGTRASFEYKPIQRTDWRGCDILRHGFVTEISVLSPSVKPAEPLAQVLTFGPLNVPPKAATSAVGRVAHARPAADDVEAQVARQLAQAWQSEAPPGIIRRPGVGRVLAIR